MDRAVLDAINHVAASPPLDLLMVTLTLSLPALAILPITWWREHKRSDAVTLSAAMFSALAAALIIQFTAQRLRPDDVRIVIEAPNFPSFPSGHAAIAAAFASFVALRDKNNAVAAIALAFGIGLSRVYLGHHYPSDVLIGWIAGASSGAMAHGLTTQGTDRPRWAWFLWGQLALCLLAIASATLGLTKFGILLIPGADKTLHFVLFGMLAFFFAAWTPKKSLLFALAAVATLEELSQAFVSTRTFDWLDLTCTLSGIAAGGVLGLFLRNKSLKNSEARTAHTPLSWR